MGKFCFFILLIILQAKVIFAQDPLLKHYTSNDGLASSTIYRMIQDKEGFIWFGTDAGVSRFDGKKFDNFTLADGLSDNEILSLKEDSKGRIWFLGFNGTVSYWLDNKIYNSVSDTLLKNVTTSSSFIDFFEDSEGRLWFISQTENIIIENNKIIKPDKEKLPSAYIVIHTKNNQLIISTETPYQILYNNGKITTVYNKYHLKRGNNYCMLKNGSVLFPSTDGLILQKGIEQNLLIPFTDDLKNSPQLGIQLSDNNLLWMTTINGVYCYDYKNLKAAPIIYLKHKIHSYILEDKEGNIWLSSLDDGVYMMPAWGLKINLYHKGNGLMNNQCFSVHKTSNGDMLVGLNKGQIAVISKGKTDNFEKLLWRSIDRAHHIVSLNDDIWIGCDSKLIHSNKKRKIYEFIKTKYRDSTIQFIEAVKDISIGKDNVFIARNYFISAYPIPNLSTSKDKKNYRDTSCIARTLVQSDSRIYSIHSSFSGELWYGAKEGLKSLKNKQFYTHYNEHILLTKRINAISETLDSVLILATHGYGIIFYKKGKIIHHLTTAAGLCNDICRRLFVYRNNIYVATPSGVSVITYKNNMVQNIVNLNSGNFLPFNDVNDVYADEKEVCVATMNGLTIIQKEAIDKSKPIIPLLQIKSISVNDSTISSKTYSNFSYKQNSLTFSFIGIFYQMPDDVNYRYRLKEEQTWVNTKNNLLEFSFLPPGEYNFQLQARIKNGDWSPIKKYSFTIHPPFWQRVWFMFLVFLLGLFLVYIIIKLRFKSIKKQQDEKTKIEKQISDLEQQALQTMMNPHFIFNVMNSIQHFINDNNKKAANQYLSDFAKLIRMNLTISYKRYIPLDEEIDYLKLYLSFEKLRFGDKLTFEITIDSLIDTNETPVAVMMIQPFLENAIWHGILPTNSVGHVSLEIKKESEELLKIIITDNGVGIKDSYINHLLIEQKKESHGLNMTLQRLKLLGNVSGHSLAVKYSHLHPEKTQKGTVVEMLLPTAM